MAVAMKMGNFGVDLKPAPVPPMVTDLKAEVGNQTLTVSWKNPDSSRLAGVVVVYSDKKYPENPYDGTRVDAKMAESVVLDGLVNGTEYFIRVFPYNADMDYNTKPEGATISGTPADAPAPATNVQIAGKGGTCTVTWVNPADPTLAEIVVMQTVGKPSTALTDGTEVYRGLEQTYTATGLEPNKDYYWTVYALNATGRYKGFASSTKYSYTASKVLNDNTWDVISAIAKKGEGASYWKVGDAKAVEINGTVGIKYFSGTYYCFILGFNHNEALEGKGIHFSFGKSALNNGKDIVFTDGAFNTNYEDKKVFGFRIHTSKIGSWGICDMRLKICPLFFKALPKEMQSCITICKKWTCKRGGAIEQFEESIFLPSEFEIAGRIESSYSSESNYQKQYDYYKAGNDVERDTWYWLRSPTYKFDGDEWCDYGDFGFAPAIMTYSMGFAPCFKV